MPTEKTVIDLLPKQLKVIKEAFYDSNKLKITQLTINAESKEYEACAFLLNNKKVVYRQAKITPTKSGQFVTIWKRNSAGITAPFDEEDNFDYFVITVINNEKIGQFIFPKTVLNAKGIISHNSKTGKRGMRVYVPSDAIFSKQAIQTQKWQADYFYVLTEENSAVMKSFRELF
ncbi:hypothetical protein HNP99_002096 [Flavobacterium sp. 28A]|uniref:MepB family protein n=1 Tax=Flavobacterium sp. 28A TaxID=2735895 RepID=UPI00156DB986|nr:MepB family protein [Flavobacterium sp. 28A]NRT15739.1 hypothetical protein [Flavobacterium sp. 28A]